MEDGIRLIVLDDCETWSGGGYVVEVTEAAYDEIMDGTKIYNIEEGIKVVGLLGSLEQSDDAAGGWDD